MIDWDAKVRELKAMADEMELWAAKSETHIKLILGRNADEIRRLAHQIELELLPSSERGPFEPPPDWITEAQMPAVPEEPDQGETEWSADQAPDQLEPGDATDPEL
jgi:hypothetical protein